MTKQNLISKIQFSSEKEKPDLLIAVDRQKLPKLVEMLLNPNYIVNLNTIDQQSWDQKKQSRLIESFLINIPVPPIILYEVEYDQYEIMDGRQRLISIKNFYQNKYQLTNLEVLKTCQGKIYNDLPEDVKVRLDRKSLAFTTIIVKTDLTEEEKQYLKEVILNRYR